MTILKYCAWCRVLLDVIEDASGTLTETHGICERCFELALAGEHTPETRRRNPAREADGSAITDRSR